MGAWKVVACLSLAVVVVAFARTAAAESPSPLTGQMKKIDGSSVDLSQYKGKTVLIVNVASKCGYTSQYKGLQSLYDKYKDQGLVILGFPANEFGGQEPGSDAEIAKFCSTKYGVTFDMFSKIEVKGPKMSPLYKTLTESSAPPGDVKWNFEKFLVGRDGKVAGRFASGVSPEDPAFVKAIEASLAKGG
jgi:glutathione peroxidase